VAIFGEDASAVGQEADAELLVLGLARHPDAHGSSGYS
jgi:hypothetical protein